MSKQPSLNAESGVGALAHAHAHAAQTRAAAAGTDMPVTVRTGGSLGVRLRKASAVSAAVVEAVHPEGQGHALGIEQGDELVAIAGVPCVEGVSEEEVRHLSERASERERARAHTHAHARTRAHTCRRALTSSTPLLSRSPLPCFHRTPPPPFAGARARAARRDAPRPGRPCRRRAPLQAARQGDSARGRCRQHGGGRGRRGCGRGCRLWRQCADRRARRAAAAGERKARSASACAGPLLRFLRARACALVRLA